MELQQHNRINKNCSLNGYRHISSVSINNTTNDLKRQFRQFVVEKLVSD